MVLDPYTEPEPAEVKMMSSPEVDDMAFPALLDVDNTSKPVWIIAPSLLPVYEVGKEEYCCLSLPFCPMDMLLSKNPLFEF